MANTPPSRSYRLFSDTVCLACAYALSAPAKATGAAVSANPATRIRLVMEVERTCAIGHLLGDVPKGITVPSVCELYWLGGSPTCQRVRPRAARSLYLSRRRSPYCPPRWF